MKLRDNFGLLAGAGALLALPVIGILGARSFEHDLSQRPENFDWSTPGQIKLDGFGDPKVLDLGSALISLADADADGKCTIRVGISYDREPNGVVTDMRDYSYPYTGNPTGNPEQGVTFTSQANLHAQLGDNACSELLNRYTR